MTILFFYGECLVGQGEKVCEIVGQIELETTCPSGANEMECRLDHYEKEIECRSLVTQKRLSVDCDNIKLEISPTGVQNFVVLNDRDFYFDNNTGVPYKYEMKWQFLQRNNNSSFDDNIKYIILTPGDYRGYLKFDPSCSPGNPVNCSSGDCMNTGEERRYLLYYPGCSSDDPSRIVYYFNKKYCHKLKPAYEQAEEEKAIVENFRLLDGNWKWTVMGITFRGNRDDYPSVGGNDPNVLANNIVCGEKKPGGTRNEITSSENIIRYCLFENVAQQNCIKITSASRNIIANNVIRNRADCTKRDIIGITLKGNYGVLMEDNIIIDNEIYNMGDAIQLVYGPGNNNVGKGSAPGTFIHGNKLFNEKVILEDQEIHPSSTSGNPGSITLERTHGEGAIDLKMGAGPYNVVSDPGFDPSVDPIPNGISAPVGEVLLGDKVIISYNDIYGWREGTYNYCGGNPGGIGGNGGDGDAITIHGNTKNVAIVKNNIFDCTNGIYVNTEGAFDSYYELDGNDTYVGVQVEHIEVYANVICNLYPYGSDDYAVELEVSTSDLSATNAFLMDYISSGNNLSSMQYGIALSVSIESARIYDNSVNNVIQGIRFGSAAGCDAQISDNYFSNILNQFFWYPGSASAYTNFTNNFFLDSNYGCSGITQSDLTDDGNCFSTSSGTGNVPVVDICSQ